MKISRSELRSMISEQMRIGYELDGPRSEFYGGGRRAMDVGDEDLDPEYDILGLNAMGLMGDPYSIDDSQDAMDADIDLYASDDLSALEREMRRQGRMPPHHHDDDYSDLGTDDMMMEESKGQKMKISRRELRSMISEQMGEDMMMTPEPRMISMSNPVSALREVMAAVSAGESFAIAIDGDSLRAVARVFNMPVEEGSLQEQPVPAPLILAGVGMVVLLGLIAFGIHKGYGVRLRGGGGIGGKKGPRGEGEVIFAPGGQDIPDTSIGKELSAEKAKMLAAGE